MGERIGLLHKPPRSIRRVRADSFPRTNGSDAACGAGRGVVGWPSPQVNGTSLHDRKPMQPRAAAARSVPSATARRSIDGPRKEPGVKHRFSAHHETRRWSCGETGRSVELETASTYSADCNAGRPSLLAAKPSNLARGFHP